MAPLLDNNNNNNHTTSFFPSLLQLHSTRNSLQTATHILTGLTHRNKNQHRGTKWWGPFTMLRRSLQKILPDLDAAIQRAELAVLLVPPAGKKKQQKTPAAAAAATPPTTTKKQPELERAVARAVWMRAVLAARAYEAFTQLTADRQFAQLGLVLLGVLAQVEAALAPLVPAGPVAAAGDGSGPVVVRVAQEVGASSAGARAVLSRAGANAGDVDLGVAISREELDEGGAQGKRLVVEEPISAPIPRLPSTKEGRDPDRTTSKKRKKQRLEDDEPRTESTETFFENPEEVKARKKPRAGDDKTRTTRPEMLLEDPKEKRQSKKQKLEDPSSRTTLLDELEEVRKPEKKKKKKKKGGDEFDDLFSSLL